MTSDNISVCKEMLSTLHHLHFIHGWIGVEKEASVLRSLHEKYNIFLEHFENLEMMYNGYRLDTTPVYLLKHIRPVYNLTTMVDGVEKSVFISEKKMEIMQTKLQHQKAQIHATFRNLALGQKMNQ